MRKPVERMEFIHDFVERAFAGSLHAKRIVSLANGVVGVVTGASLAVSVIGHALARARGLVDRHAIKQVDRLLSNAGVVVWELFAPWVREVVGQREAIVVAMDWTDFDADNQATLALNLVTRHGRATPLLWLTVDKDELKDQRNDFEDLCLCRLKALLPEGVAVTILADRGFGDVKLFEFLDSLGFGYVIRFRGNVQVAAADGQTRLAADWVGKGGRYAELQELLATRRMKSWSSHRFGAEALVRQGLWEAAISFAEAARSSTNPDFSEMSIDRFCEKLLIDHGRADEAYRRYGLRAASGTTNISVYRSLVRTYPDRDHRRMLLDLIETRGDKGKWFAAAKESRFFDIAIECATAQGADPSTLVRAARDFCGKEPKFAATVALLALSSLLAGGGYDPSVSEVDDAVKHLLSASRQIGEVEWALRELSKLAERQCAAGREAFQHAIQAALSHWHLDEPNL